MKGRKRKKVSTKSIMIVFAAMTLLAAGRAEAACTAIQSAAYDLGSRTTGQAANGVSQTYTASAGLHCSGVLLGLLSSNRTDATIHSQNGFQLVSSTGQSVSYVASPLADGSRPIAQDSTVHYADPALISLMLLGSSSDFDLPISFLSFRGSNLTAGTYTDTVVINWNWNVCDGVALTNSICLFYSTGTAKTTITVTMVIQDKRPIVTISSQTTFDPVNGATRAKAIPGATIVDTIVVQNPDVVPLDADGVVLTVPVPANVYPAIASSTAVQLVQGNGLTLSYAGASSTGDDVDFACGSSAWTCTPATGSQVTSIRARVRGTLAAGASVSVAVTYTMK